MRRERGQATVEWIGLVLGVALIMVALLAGGRDAAKGESGRGLGAALAKRITCAVRGECAREAGGAGEERGPSQLRGQAGGGPRGVLGAERPRVFGNPPGGRLSVLEPHAGGRSVFPNALRALGGAKRFLKRTWFPCLAVQNWQYDRKHPRPPGQALPLRETARRLNECLNPFSFVFGS